MALAFDEEKIKAVIMRALDRFSKGDRLYILADEVVESGLTRELIEKMTQNVFDKMAYQFLMYGDEKPAGVCSGSYDLSKSQKSIRERLKNI